MSYMYSQELKLCRRANVGPLAQVGPLEGKRLLARLQQLWMGFGGLT